MKKIALVFSMALIATTILAGTAMACGDSIYDIQTDPANHPVGTLGVPCDVIVTGVCGSGMWVQQEVDPGINPNGEYSGIWVYTGDTPPYVAGDILSICGVITEFFGLTELDVPGAGVYGYVLQTGTGPPLTPFNVTAADLVADGEPWESVQIKVVDGMEVPIGFDLNFGEWRVDALDGSVLRFDDCFYDFGTVVEGQCYNSAVGIYTYSFNNFKLEPFADGIDIVNCAVSTETITMGTIKALFR